MKNLKYLFLALVLSFAFVSNSYALSCKNGNYGSDECWTTAQLTTNDVGKIIAGTAMVYDFTTGINEGNSAENAAFFVRTATTADQGAIVAGVAEKTYASGDRALLLVRGKGKVRVNGAVTSGDRLWLIGGTGQERGLFSNSQQLDAVNAASDDRVLAFALSTTSAAATTDAFITIV